MAAALGDFLVNITTKVKDKDAQRLVGTLNNLAKSAAKIGTVFAASIGGLAYGFTKLVGSTAQETAELGRLSKDLGVSSNFLETFSRAFETMGAGSDEAISAIRTLKSEIEAFRVGKGNYEAFGMLGINPQDFSNDVSKNFTVIRNRFNQLTDEQRLYWVTQIGLGEKSLRILRLNDEEYNNLLRTSASAPLATSEQIENAERYTESINKLSQSFQGLRRSVLVSALPAFENFIDRFNTLFQDKDFQENIGKFFNILFEQLEKLGSSDVIEKVGKLADGLYGIARVASTVGSGVNYFVKGSEQLGKSAADLVNNYMDRTFLQSEIKNQFKSKDNRLWFNKKSKGVTQTENPINGVTQTENPISKIVNQSSTNSAPISNNFDNNINITFERITDVEDFKKKVPGILEDSLMGTANKMTSNNFKKGVIR